MLGELGFELGDAPVGEADVGACGLEPFFERPVVLGELADALLERGVLGIDPLDGVVGEFAFGVAELPEQLSDAGALGAYLGAGGFQGVFGVERPLAPRRLGLSVSACLVTLPLGRMQGASGLHQRAGIAVFVKKVRDTPA